MVKSRGGKPCPTGKIGKMKNKELWHRIEEHEVGGAEFAVNLSQDTGWSAERTAGAITEYKRFAYLSALVKTARRVAPAPVDLVWEKHTQDFDDYDRFCNLLGKELKRPESGGSLGGADFQRTLRVYEREFGRKPPALHWPSPDRIVFRIAAGVFIVAGVATSLAAGSVWPGLIGVATAALLIFAPRSKGRDHGDAMPVTGFDGD